MQSKNKIFKSFPLFLIIFFYLPRMRHWKYQENDDKSKKIKNKQPFLLEVVSRLMLVNLHEPFLALQTIVDQN